MSYLTPAEYVSAPTAVDTSRLVYGSDAAANTAELVTCIERASSWIDDTTGNPLVATVRHVTGRVSTSSDGFLVLRPGGVHPLVNLVSVSTGWAANALTALGDLSGTWIDRELHAFMVPLSAGVPSGPALGLATGRRGRLMARYSYVAGFPNTTLAATAAQGATQLTVRSTAGMVAAAEGQSATVLTIVDAGDTETVTVTAVVSATVVQTTALAHTHTFGADPAKAIAVHAMPQSLKSIAVLRTSIEVRQRGNNAATFADSTDPPSQLDPVSARDWFTIRDGLVNWRAI